MLLSIARSKQSFTIIFLPFLAIILWFHVFRGAESSFIIHPTSSVALWISNFFGTGFWARFVFLFLLILSAFYLNILNTKYIFIPERTYLPGILFVMLVSVLNFINIPLILALLLFLLALDRLIATYKVEHLLFNAFDASFLISLATLIYVPSVFLILFVWMALISLRPFYWREWAYTILGLVLPYLLIWCFMFVFNKDFSAFIKPVFENFTETSGALKLSRTDSLYIFIVSFLIIITSQKLLRLFPSMKIISRKIFNLQLALFFISLIIPIAMKYKSFEFWYFSAIPLSYVFAIFFLNVKKSWWGELLFISLFAADMALIYFL